MKRELRNIESAAARHQRALAVLEQRVLDAHHAGCSLRQIAQAAGVSHETVRRIISDGQRLRIPPREFYTLSDDLPGSY